MKRDEDWVIEAQDVSYTYDGNNERALDGLNLKIRRGTKVAFMGGNGSGKSTFFLCLNGIRRPDTGKICIDGKAIEYTRKGLLEVRAVKGVKNMIFGGEGIFNTVVTGPGRVVLQTMPLTAFAGAIASVLPNKQ